MGVNAKAALALLALAVTASWATSTLPTYNETCNVMGVFNPYGGPTTDGGNAFSFIVVTFALVSFVIGLAYMYSKVREDAATGVWAKDEAYNLIISVLLFAGILIFFTASCEIAVSSSDKENPIKASQNYLDTLIQSNGLNVLKRLSSDSITNQLDATKYLYLGLSPFWGDGVAMKANRKAHSANREYLIDLYLPILASLTAQKYVLQGIAWMGASVLLPFAFVMRLVPPTREFGNMLIALFFGMYIVVPAMYAMSAQIFTDHVRNVGVPYTVDPSLQKFQSYGLDNNQYPPSDTQIKGTTFYMIGSTIPQAVFLPNLVIVVAVTSIMALSKALRAIAV